MPCDYKQYPENWLTEIRPAILKRADNRCEGSPAYPECRAEKFSLPFFKKGEKAESLNFRQLSENLTALLYKRGR